MKKLISVLLAALMLACILPLGAFAIEEESVTFYYTDGIDQTSADGNINLCAYGIGSTGWVVDINHTLMTLIANGPTIITRIVAVVSAGGENCGEIYVLDGYAQADGSTVTVTDINDTSCLIHGNNTDPVEFSQVTIYYTEHVHSFGDDGRCNCGMTICFFEGHHEYGDDGNCTRCGENACVNNEHSYDPTPVYICRWCGAESPTPDGAGSTLSEGNLTIVVGVACLALGLVGGIVIGRKKKTGAE